MTQTLRALRGMKDILPTETPVWQFLESHLMDIAKRYGYQEIRFPILEFSALFSRSVGNVTDIVEKEMYAFVDRNGEELALRPEGTAGCARAVIEHSLTYASPQRLWYCGPMFRHERPQKGRQRQFHHFGVEALGFDSPAADVECLLMSARLWETLGIGAHVNLQINSLGDTDERMAYRHELQTYFRGFESQLDEESKRRLESNPLRILDSKNPGLQDMIQGAPKLLDYLGEDSRTRFETIQQLLNDAKVAYTVNPLLVRGLDYYSHTVYEWQTEYEGAQNAVCAGGRYDSLIAQLGGPPTPACGFAMGLERIVALIETHVADTFTMAPHFYGILIGEPAVNAGILMAENLRCDLPHARVQLHLSGGGFKSQFKKADKAGAAYALIIGEDELTAGTVTVKPLRGQGEQVNVALSELSAHCNTVLSEC